MDYREEGPCVFFGRKKLFSLRKKVTALLGLDKGKSRGVPLVWIQIIIDKERRIVDNSYQQTTAEKHTAKE